MVVRDRWRMRNLERATVLRRYSDCLGEGNFPESKLFRQYSKYAEHLSTPFFWLRQYSIHAEHHVCVTALREILLLEEIQG
jgi:hypothetical protein